MSLVNIECCICSQHIDKDSKLDPCAITIYTNIDKDESEQLEQIFFTHYECFRRTLESDLCEMLNLEDRN